MNTKPFYLWTAEDFRTVADTMGRTVEDL